MSDFSYETAEDGALIARFASGDRAALGQLAERYERSLLGLAQGMLGGDRAGACDAVQAMWVRVIRYGKGFRGESGVKTWLYRILINECREARAGVRSFRLLREGAKERGAGHAKAIEPDDSAARLRVAMKGMLSEQREVLLLCYHAGMSHSQAAEILEIPVGTLKSRLHGALVELHEAMGVKEGVGT